MAVEVKIRRLGRWRWLVYVTDGVLPHGPDGYGWYVWGRRRAEQKAQRVLRRYLRNRDPEVYTVARDAAGQEARDA